MPHGYWEWYFKADIIQCCCHTIQYEILPNGWWQQGCPSSLTAQFSWTPWNLVTFQCIVYPRNAFPTAGEKNKIGQQNPVGWKSDKALPFTVSAVDVNEEEKWKEYFKLCLRAMEGCLRNVLTYESVGYDQPPLSEICDESLVASNNMEKKKKFNKLEKVRSERRKHIFSKGTYGQLFHHFFFSN